MSDPMAVYVFGIGVVAISLIIVGAIILWRELLVRPSMAWSLAAAHACMTALVAWKTVWLTDHFTLGIVQFLFCLSARIATSFALKRSGLRLTIKSLFGALIAGVGTVVIGYLLTWMTVSGVI